MDERLSIILVMEKLTKQLMKYLETYRGAHIYRFQVFGSEEGSPLNYKLIAKATHCSQLNLQEAFKAEANTEDEALKLIKASIDHYLDDQGLDRFN